MLVAISPSVHRLRMSSLDCHGDATSSHSANHGASIAQGGAASATEYLAKSHARPKLSLQTSSLPSPYAKSSKGILGSAGVLSSTATPTISNTIANSVQAIPHRPSPVTPGSPFSRVSTSRPYAQPIGLRSILKNAPDSPKLGMKRSHSLFSADSDSPHAKRRIFFPPEKQVKFEGDGKLAVEIPANEELSLPESGSTETESEVLDPKDAVSVAVSDKQEDESASVLATAPKVTPTSRTRNGTPPPPKPATPRKKRKVRKWEWTITSPRVTMSENSK